MSAQASLADIFVFLDDSAFELALVEEALPEVQCCKVPDRLSEYPALIRRLSREFLTLPTTSEDSLRTDMYHREEIRKNEARQFRVGKSLMMLFSGVVLRQGRPNSVAWVW